MIIELGIVILAKELSEAAAPKLFVTQRRIEDAMREGCNTVAAYHTPRMITIRYAFDRDSAEDLKELEGMKQANKLEPCNRFFDLTSKLEEIRQSARPFKDTDDSSEDS